MLLNFFIKFDVKILVFLYGYEVLKWYLSQTWLYCQIVVDLNLTKTSSADSDSRKQLIIPFLVRKTPTNSSKGSKSPSTSSPSYQKKLSDVDHKYLETIQDKIKKNKWVLKSSGRSVEDVMFEFGIEYDFENPLHCYILYLEEEELKFMFTIEETKEIMENKIDLHEHLPQPLDELLSLLSSKTKVQDVDDIFDNILVKRTNEGRYWCKYGVLDYLNLHIDQDTVRQFHSESSLLDEVYGFVKKSSRLSKTCFDLNKGSRAVADNRNLRRALGKYNKTPRQLCGEVPDGIFSASTGDIGCIEIGLQDKGPGGTKELNEQSLKLPKIMRSFAWKLINDYNATPEELQIPGFIMSGGCLTANIMTFRGSVALLSKSRRVKLPPTINGISRIKKPMKLVYNAQMRAKETVQYLEKLLQNDDDNVVHFFHPAFAAQPPSTNDSNNTNKKRKSVENSYNEEQTML